MRLLVILIALLIASHASADDNERLDVNSIITAFKTACLDFKNQLGARDTESEFSAFASDITNYKITAYSDEQFFVVQFSPKSFHGALVRGGVTVYKLDATGERIVDLQRFR
jgi:hypothetical protein